jgi:hypothetical protein
MRKALGCKGMWWRSPWFTGGTAQRIPEQIGQKFSKKP